MFYKRYSCAVTVLALLLVVPEISRAKEVSVDFAPTPIVSVVDAGIIDRSEHELTIAGKFNRIHRWPTRGHLHLYSYSDSGAVIFDSKHRLRRLNSKNRKHSRFHFKLSIEDAIEETKRIILEYHRSGCQES